LHVNHTTYTFTLLLSIIIIIIIITIIIYCNNNVSGKYWAVISPKLYRPTEDPEYQGASVSPYPLDYLIRYSFTVTPYYPYQRYIATFQGTDCEVLGSSDVLE